MTRNSIFHCDYVLLYLYPFPFILGCFVAWDDAKTSFFSVRFTMLSFFLWCTSYSEFFWLHFRSRIVIWNLCACQDFRLPCTSYMWSAVQYSYSELFWEATVEHFGSHWLLESRLILYVSRWTYYYYYYYLEFKAHISIAATGTSALHQRNTNIVSCQTKVSTALSCTVS